MLSFLYLDLNYFIIVGPALLLAIGAQLWVKGAIHRWSQVPSESGLTGRQVAQRVLDEAGIPGVQIEPSHGMLSDHYDPRERKLRLSPQVFDGRSVAAAAIAAHEAGHAIQHAQKYAPLELRNIAVPVAMFGSGVAPILFFVGLLLNSFNLALVGLIGFAAVAVFQLITLPVEFDASRRARAVLRDTNLIVSADEERGVNAVLTAAAMNYVAALVQTIMTLVYYVLILQSRSRRD